MNRHISSEAATNTIRFLERAISRAPAVTRPSTLQQLRLAPDRVRQLLDHTRPMTPAEVRRAMVHQVKKGSCGRGGLPAYVVDAMYADYQRLKSLAKVAKLHGRTRQSIYTILAKRNLALNSKVFQAKIRYDGRDYTPDKNGYYRDTIFRAGRNKLRHHVVWIGRYGPIPPGHQVFFRDGNKHNFAIDNLGCLPIAEVSLYHHRRHLRQESA